MTGGYLGLRPWFARAAVLAGIGAAVAACTPDRDPGIDVAGEADIDAADDGGPDVGDEATDGDGRDGADAWDAADDTGLPDAGTEADAGEDGGDAAGLCGNGGVDPGEECDGDPPRSCDPIGCEVAGRQSCIDCRWEEACAVRADECGNGLDDDCDGITDGFRALGPEVRVREEPLVWEDRRDAAPEPYFRRIGGCVP